MIAENPACTFDSRLMVWRSAADSAQAGGDWCEAFPVAERVVALTIGDVSGHGAAVAGTMAAMRASVLRAMHEIAAPSDVLSRVNDVACSFDGGVIVTAIVAILDESARTLTFASAGHPAPLMLTDDADAFIQHLPADLPLGIFPNYRAADCVITLPPKALLVFYTDGITEHERDPIRGETELVDAARLVLARPDVNAARAIARRVFKGSRGGDDAAAICLRTPA